MRSIILFLLTIGLISPAMAQLQPLNPRLTQPQNLAPATSPTGGPKLTPDGKVQIGYDKRSDYRLIKQPTGITPPAPAPAQTANIPNSPALPDSSFKDLEGDIFNPAAAPKPAASPRVAAAPAATPVAAAATPASTPAAAAKPRSDSALRSDASPAKAAAAAAQAATAAKAAEDKKQADALAAAIAAAQKAGALPLKPQ